MRPVVPEGTRLDEDGHPRGNRSHSHLQIGLAGLHGTTDEHPPRLENVVSVLDEQLRVRQSAPVLR